MTVFLLAAALAVGLMAYERWGLRLGGILALPLVAIYALRDPAVVFVLAVACLVAWAGLTLARDRTSVYGRPLLYIALLSGVLAVAVLSYVLPLGNHGLALALLPGVVVFNAHRDDASGRTPALLLVVGLVAGSISLLGGNWFLDINPDLVVGGGAVGGAAGSVIEPDAE